MLIAAILRKNWQRSFASRGTLVYHLFHVGFQVVLFLGISRAIGRPGSAETGESYAGFVLPALGAAEIMTAALLAPRHFLESESQTRTLEQIALSSPSLLRLMLLESAGPLLKGLLELASYWIACALLVGAPETPLPLLAAGLAILFAQFWLLGIFSAGALLVFRRGASLNTLILSGATLLGGIYFPLSHFPPWIRSFARLSALPAVNETLRGQGSWSALAPSAACLAISALLLPVFFELCLRRSRHTGSLAY